ncbi:hypothetical protein BC938DRAFT_482845, partial [Jimgerdemannia flammicorona]
MIWFTGYSASACNGPVWSETVNKSNGVENGLDLTVVHIAVAGIATQWIASGWGSNSSVVYKKIVGKA